MTALPIISLARGCQPVVLSTSSSEPIDLGFTTEETLVIYVYPQPAFPVGLCRLAGIRCREREAARRRVARSATRWRS